MTFFMGDTEPDFAIPAGTEGSAGPQTGFMDNFWASYQAQRDVHSAFGADESMATLEQQQLDKLYDLTGERLSPIFPGTYAGTGPSKQERFAVMHSLAGDTLDAEQQALVGEAQKQFDKYNSLAQKNGLLTYDQMFKQVQQNAQQEEANAASAGSRSTLMGSIGGTLGGGFGNMTYRDPINLASIALGGVGKTALTRIVAEMGVQGLAQAAEIFTGGAENQRLLTGEGPTAAEIASQIAGAALGAGVIRGGGEVAAHGFGALVRHFGARAPDVAARAMAKEAEEAIGPSPYGPSRIGQGMHEADVRDALARDVPINQRPVAGRLVEPPVAGGKLPIAPLASPAADELFNGTLKPLANIFDVVPATPEMDRANAALASLTDQIQKADAAAATADDTFAAANGGRTMQVERRRLVSALDDNNASQAELRARMTGAPDTDGELAGALERLKRERGALEAGADSFRDAFVRQEGAAAAAAHLRLVRAHLVNTIADVVPDAQRSGGVQTMLDKSAVASDGLRPIDRRVASASASDELEKTISEPAERSAPHARIIPAPEGSAPGTPDMVELGQHSGPVDLDMEVVVGLDLEADLDTAEIPPLYKTIREILQDHAEDDALVKAMKECLIA